MDWTKRSYKLHEITEWRFPTHALPLTGRILHAKDFGEGSDDEDRMGVRLRYDKEVQKSLKEIFENFGPVVEVYQPSRDLEVTFFHPYAFHLLFQQGRHYIRDSFLDIDFPKELGIDLSNSMDHEHLWFGGCPGIEELNIEYFQQIVTNHIIRATSNQFDFDVQYDPIRRELIACPFMKKDSTLPPYVAARKIREMIVEQAVSLNSEAVVFDGKEVLLMVRGASSIYVEKWKARLDAGLPLSAHEMEQMEWTDLHLRKVQSSDNSSSSTVAVLDDEPSTSNCRKRNVPNFSTTLTTVGQSKHPKLETTGDTEEPIVQNMSSSDSTRYLSPTEMDLPSLDSDNSLDSITTPASSRDASDTSSNLSVSNAGNPVHAAPIYAAIINDEVEVVTLSDEDDEDAVIPAIPVAIPLQRDGVVMSVLQRLLKKSYTGYELAPEFSMELTEFDLKSMQKRLRLWGFKQKTVKKKTEAQKYEITGYPYLTPPSYELVGKKTDSFGCLRFYDASNSLGDRELAEMPQYEFIDENEVPDEYSNEVTRSGAKTFNMCCDSTCDPAVGCLPDSCECMKNSSLVNNRVDESRRVDRIVECCAKCPCHLRTDRCPSIVQYRKVKFHVVHLENMGFALRVMQPVQRGEPLIEFTGVRTNYVSDVESNWAYTSASCSLPKDRKFTGIDDTSADFLINPHLKGNAARFICHSYFANAAWMTLFRGGAKTTDPEAIVYALEPLEAGEILYINYGREFGIKKNRCRCTQELCHDPKIIKWLKGFTWEQGMTLLKERELKKRQRIIETEMQAKIEFVNRISRINRTHLDVSNHINYIQIDD